MFNGFDKETVHKKKLERQPFSNGEKYAAEEIESEV